ncbi:hypothetical protein JKF63_04704 [Porcisia hertigi]|uniref:Kinesin motor domain-containing protein n=1 Tax=Porcisia hertigi TaxID=2761500 RepID=A0A836IPZ4_9TRYP|nr:hypothetical protein JKF63_04704 [Porcisia hertigi]
MYSQRQSSSFNVRRQSDRGASLSMISQLDSSFTESSPYTASVSSEVQPHLQRSSPPLTAGSVSQQHLDDANLSTDAGVTNTHDNLRVAVRVRPPLPRELHCGRSFVDVVQIEPGHANSITLCDALEIEDGRGAVYSRQSYTFDRVYGADATQEEVYELSARPAVLSVLEGYNATLMAYGQTGTGKTYTMEGFTNEEERGIIPRAVESVFEYIQERRHTNEGPRFLVQASYMQIYNEVISDLLGPPSTAFSTGNSGGASRSSSGLSVRHTPQRGVYVDGLSEWIVRTPEDVYGLIAKGTALRATSATRLSELSSRSHAIFTILVEAVEGDEANPHSYRFGKLNIVDLAGSEKIRLSGVTGQRLEETKSINKSLHELGNVIAALAAKSVTHGRRAQRHIPFRNSALTSALRDSLGGNCKTTLIACISPALESYAESLSTLTFANRAKNIQSHAVVNEAMDQTTLLRAYEQELRRLRLQLQEGTDRGNGSNNRPTDSDGTQLLLSELEEDRRHAEAARQTALTALEESSAAHHRERHIRQGLENRIRELEAIVREGGMEGNPRTSQEYAERFLELDRDRQAVEEDKEQVERYKHLLLKQRDIMLGLTARLNDRDETILLLQEKVDAYDKHVQKLEEKLELAVQQGETGRRAASSPRSSTVMSVVDLQLVGSASETQAADYIYQRRVLTPSMESGLRACELPRYRSFLQPSHTVTAEELAVELVMLQGRKDTASAAASGTGRSEASESRLFGDAELARVLQQRADSIVHAHYTTQVAQLRSTIAALTLQLRNSEDKAHIAKEELRLLVHHRSGGDDDAGIDTLLGVIRAEWDSRRKAYMNTIDEVREALHTDTKERARLSREIDRLRVEVQHALETVSSEATASSDTSRRSAVSHVWQRLQEVEERVRLQGALAHLPALFPGADVVHSGAPSASDPETKLRDAQAGEKELRKAEQQQQQGGITQAERETTGNTTHWKSSAVSAPDAVEVATLRRKVMSYERDHRALRTILEQRMKTKINRICEVLLTHPDAVNDKSGAAKLRSEALSLQGLIHASIQAIDTEV